MAGQDLGVDILYANVRWKDSGWDCSFIAEVLNFCKQIETTICEG